MPAAGSAPQDSGAIEAADAGVEHDRFAGTGRQGAQRNLTSALHRSQEGAFGGNGATSLRVVERRKQTQDPGVVLARFDGERALSGRRQHEHHGDFLGNPVTEAESHQAGGGQDGRIHAVLAHFAQAGRDITPKRQDLKVAAEGTKLRGAAKT